MMMTVNVLVRLFLARTIQSVGHGIGDLAKGHGISQLDSERFRAVYFTDLFPTDTTVQVTCKSRGLFNVQGPLSWLCFWVCGAPQRFDLPLLE